METQTITKDDVSTVEATNIVNPESKQVGMLEFIEAHEKSVQDGTGTKGVAAKTGLTENTCQARASKYRNPEYKKVNKMLDGKIVYRLAVDGENGETETVDKTDAKLSKQGKPVVIKIDALNAKGEKIKVRPGISLSTMPRGGHSRIVGQVDAAEALLAKLRGETPADAESNEEAS